MTTDHQSRPMISTTQLMSSALAAVTAAVVGSRLGIAGTLIGAAAGSVIGTAGTAMYAHWLDRTATRVRTVVRLPTVRRDGSADITEILATEDDATLVQPSRAAQTLDPADRPVAATASSRQPTWRTVTLAAVATFAVSIGSITAFEAIAGEPVSSLTGGDSGNGTTLGRAVEADPLPVVHTDPTTSPTTPPTTDPTTPPTTDPTTPPPTTDPTTPPPTTDPTTPPTEPTTPPPTTQTPPPAPGD
jgi:hypothetical protein